jgi:predicted small metal-binding protein
MLTCDCGWTIISPQGEGDVKKRAMMHLRDAHPGMSMTEEETRKLIKSV